MSVEVSVKPYRALEIVE